MTKPPLPEILLLLKRYSIDVDQGKVYNKDREICGLSNGYFKLSLWDSTRKKVVVVKRSHIVFWAYHGIWPEQEVDHKNRDKTDDRISNLRDVPHKVNSLNVDYSLRQRRKVRDLPLGVHRHNSTSTSKPFKAVYAGRHLGIFSTVGEAEEAYNQARGKDLDSCS